MSAAADESARQVLALLRRMDAKLDDVLRCLARMESRLDVGRRGPGER